MLKKFFKQLFCHHIYVIKKYLIPEGLSGRVTFIDFYCTKCGKIYTDEVVK